MKAEQTNGLTPDSSDSAIEAEKRDLRRGAGQILSGFGVRIIARILLIAFVAKLYGVVNFGRLGETIAIVELTAALATFGLNKTLLGRMAGLAKNAAPDQAHECRPIAEAMAITGFFSIASAILLWVLWPFIVNPAAVSTSFAILGIPLIALAEIALTATRHRRNVAWDTIVKAVVKPWGFLLLALAGFVWLESGGDASLTAGEALIAAYIASLAIAAIAAFYALFRVFGPDLLGRNARPDIGETIAFAKQSLPIAINETAVFAFRRIDIIILALVAGPGATGIYYLAQQVGTVVEKVRYLFEPMLAPIFAQTTSLSTIGYHLRRLCLLIFATQIAIIALFAIVGGPILDWLGAGFAAGLVVVLVVLLGEMADGSFGLCELPMVYRHPAWPPRAGLLTLLIEIVLVTLFARQMGAIGAAAGFAAAMMVLAVVRLILLRRLYKITIIAPRFGGVLVIGAIAAAATAYVFGLLGPAGGPAGGFAIAACVLVFFVIYGGGLSLLLRTGGDAQLDPQKQEAEGRR